MGVAQKDLKAMADTGQLTTDRVVPALISQLGKLKSEFNAMPNSVSAASTRIQNAFMEWVGGANQASGATATISGAMDNVAGHIDTVATAAGAMVAVGVSRYFGNWTSSIASNTGELIKNYQSQVGNAAAQLNAAQVTQRKAAANAEASVSAYNLAKAEANAAKGTNAAVLTTQNLIQKRKEMIAANAALVQSNRAVTASEAQINRLTSATATLGRGLSFIGSLVGGWSGAIMLGGMAWYYLYQKQEQARQSAIQYADTIDAVRESLNKMSSVQIGSNLGSAQLSLTEQNRAIDEQESKLQKLRRANEAAQATVENAKNGLMVFTDVNAHAARTSAELAVEEGKLEQMISKRNATQKLITDLTVESINKTVEMTGAVSSLADMYDRLNRVTRQTTLLKPPSFAGMALPALDDKQQAAVTRMERNRVRSGLKGAELAKQEAQWDIDDQGLPAGWAQRYMSDAMTVFEQNEANKPKRKGQKSEAEKTEDAYSRIIKQQQEQISLSGQNTELAKIKYQVSQGELSTLSDAKKVELMRNATALDHVNAVEKLKSLNEQLLTPDEALLKTTRERIKLLKEAAPATEEYRDMMERISKASVQDAPTFAGIDASVGGPTGELAKTAEAEKEIEKWYSKQLEIQKKFLDDKEINEKIYSDRVAEINKTHNQKLSDIQDAYKVSALASFSEVAGSATDMARQIYSESSAAYKTLFIAQKAFAVASIIMNAHIAAAKAPAELTILGGIPVGTALLASGYASAAMVGGMALAGMAHDGIDRVPETGTWLLQKGERVVTASTSAKLDSTLEKVQQVRQGQQSIGDINVSYNLTGKPDDTMLMAMDAHGRRLAKQIKQELTAEVNYPQNQFGRAIYSNLQRKKPR
ncbi:phage tail tape measure protein [Raoultella sp. BAC10a-01-01]|uniref:Phage tail tape measure protein n=1 Tax=Raoultella scottii TaxID=3040937 RepID=A0ABU8Z4W5_9ENTR